MFERRPSSLTILNDLLKQNPTWEVLADSVTNVTRKLVTEPRWKIQRLRWHTTVRRGDFFDTVLGTGKVSVVRKQLIDPNTGEELGTFQDEVEIDLGNGLSTKIPLRTMPERSVMVHNNVQMGFDFFADSLSDDDHQRIMRYVARYWPHSGDGNFIDFLSFVQNVRFHIFQLSTPDYGNPDNNPSKDPHLYLERFNEFLEDKTYNRPDFDWDKEYPAEGFGGVYLTSHVELEYDAIKNPNGINQDDTTKLFYFLAPIHLVLERYVASVYAPQFNMYKTQVAGLDLIEPSIYTWKPDAVINSYANYIASMDQHDMGTLILDNTFTSMLPLEGE